MITIEELKFLRELIKKILEEYPEVNFIIYPKREFINKRAGDKLK